jgi:branched-subunit amino acid aminotransferase/4-amino-4-deoxychorismate lyase
MICIDGRYSLEENDGIEQWITTEGIQFGIGIFETMRIVGAHIEDLSEHLVRLSASAIELNIQVPDIFEQPESLELCLRPLIEAHDESLAVIKIVLIKAGTSSRWWAHTRKFPYLKEHYENGYQVSISQVKRHSSGVLNRHKSLNYGEYWLEKQKSVENGYQEVLFLNEGAFLTECAASNIFFFKEGIWHTPQISLGLLNGIMRQRFIDYIKQNGQTVVEGNFTVEDILTADYAVLTNALMGAMPVIKIGSTAFQPMKMSERMFIQGMDSSYLLMPSNCEKN